MNPAHLITQSCVVTARSQTGPPDTYGTPTWVEVEASDLVHVQPVSSDEVEDRPAGKLTHRGFFRPLSAVGHADRVTLASGQSWEVDGPARLWTNPRTLVDVYQEVDLVGYTDTIEQSESS
jgi:hypothetical protein